MEVHVKLRGVLKSLTPPGEKVELEDGATVASLFAALKVPAERVYLVMVNNEQVRDHDRVLVEGDEVLLLPPIAGG
jgi:molybdopterin converting factor small subunit